MLKSLLIANRGEIACRIIRTARKMGVRTIAVYSDADARALHVRMADDAVPIGASPARESYLRGDRIIAAARQADAESIHSGYGFLSENADFAQAVIDAGLIWVGPKPSSITAMGLKDSAKKLMQEAGVPVTPGYLGEDQMPERLRAEADAIGYPVLIKAVAGGGGKGMRRVDRSEDFADALASCKREAASSFADDRVLIEKYILSPRHIEVQIFGDTHGNIVHLFERDCSLQRRHQKVIEEAPAPGMDAATRDAICAAAVRAAKAVDYVGAGTVEFIADASEGLNADRIWFMEMNTRLQVEHPVTEEITGVDLVEWQLRVASGEPLPKRQDELSINGWAMEARLYAENPATGFLPSTGVLDHLGLLADARIETGVVEGDEISSFYDPMIAKIITHDSTRTAALRRLEAACGSVECDPVRTNAWFLRRLLSDPAFSAGGVTTGFITENLERLAAQPKPSQMLSELVASNISLSEQFVSNTRGDVAFEMARGLRGFRLNADPRAMVSMMIDGERADIALTSSGPLLLDDSWDRPTQYYDGLDAIAFEGGAAFQFSLYRSEGNPAGESGDGAILSPMPGRIIAIDIAAGDVVIEGQKLVTLEAMKMEHSLTAPFNGVVMELNALPNGQVTEGTLLVRIEKTPE